MPVSMLSTSTLTNPRRYGRFNALDTPRPINPGMVLIKPTSISHSGTSATLGENGQVTFNAVTSLSLNGVFTADFDNYTIVVRDVMASGDNWTNLRLRLSGTDATASNYSWQEVSANNTAVTAQRFTSAGQIVTGFTSATQRSGHFVNVFGPFLSQPTAARSVVVNGRSSAEINDRAGTHSLSTSYDGFTFFPSSSNISGALAVYGIRS